MSKGKKRRRRTALAFLVIVIVGSLLFIMFNKNKAEDSYIVIDKEGEYAKLFDNNRETLIFQYGHSDKYTFKDINKVINDMKKLFDLNILLINKDEISENDLTTINKEINFDKWQKTNELLFIKAGKINRQNDMKNDFTLSQVEQSICEMISKSKLVSELKLSKLSEIISIDEYITKIKNDKNFYLLLGNDINKTVFVAYIFNKHNLSFYYLDYKSLSESNVKKLVGSNSKFNSINKLDNAIAYIIDEDNIELQITTNTNEEVAKFIDQMSIKTGTSTEESLVDANLMEQIKTYYFPDKSVLDFESYNNDMVKAKMVLDKLDYIDRRTVATDNGGATVAKDVFDATTKELFGKNATIDVVDLDEILSGNSCATWKYDSDSKTFARADDDCGGNESTYRQIVAYTYKDTTTEYYIETKEAYVDSYNNYVYADSKQQTLVGEINIEFSKEEIDTYLKSITNKLYTYRYTFLKSSTGTHLKSYEMIK